MRTDQAADTAESRESAPASSAVRFAGNTTETAGDISLRALKTHAELEACVALQRATWGEAYEDCVPASILKVSQIVGGVSGGAFTPDDRLVGFVYGLTGVRKGRLVHWSHMLAVLPEYRNLGVGRRLKEYQREVLRGLGVEMIQWTFDPLVARNAHLNLNRLGALVDAYVPDMYGNTGSALHAFGTDRFIVTWPVSDGGSARSSAQLPEAWRNAPASEAAGPDSPAVRIEIPRDVESMSIEEARVWRARTRDAFVQRLGAGYRVAAFVPGGMSCGYILVKGDVEDAG